ncbi:23S rRNA (pseudouridine(1915)-N(3))-methyltransferase RlmH [Sneathia sanguinegens]|uniref:Ribosomal RNA large subunit methyltransferase H n=1 Tax=Sneathia sanguinegens TaxID=40543 RepID=A0ABT7HIC1_9FUSO|nr:23S rRNA (pseudouridine(1915)-N(3))-methyltransferase RlmH [Sneathia sanguinegens]MDK9580261.1 23S rRNA (pseudouridine(1915)-N(3))-methyltransferase RlmH [Sneathia sanguinegens]MDU7496427.1 23S rRNA (pseudouridine(1915)-N(3))-methyltransferase RlmH [Sneathia sanguinegens]
MKINIIAIGKIKEKYIIDGIAEFSKRLSKYINLNIIELQEEVDNSTAIKKESDKILAYLSKTKSYNILLDLKGKFIDSIELSNKLFDLTLNYSEISFIIGGSRGVSREVKEKADYLLAFSKLTFPHQLFRLILLEQIYRAICISKNIKYHK